MNRLDKLEKHFGNWAIPNVMRYLIVAQILAYALIHGGVLSFSTMPLVPSAIIHGKEYWRLVTFVIAPPHMAGGFGILFLAIFWYILSLMGNAIEGIWGTFRFNVYLLLGALLTVIISFIGQIISSESLIQIFPDFLYLSVFYAFAVLNPNFEFHLFFILPVKVKWLALVSGVFVILELIGAESLGMRLAILAPVLNFLLFFQEALVHSICVGRRRRKFESKAKGRATEALHTCVFCHVTDNSHPGRDFRYRSVDGEHVAICNQCREER